MPPEKTITQSQMVRKERAQLKHAIFDVDFFHKPKIKALRYTFGAAGICAYEELIFQISRATNAEISREAALATIMEWDISNPDLFYSHCLKYGLIELTHEGNITQERVIKDQEACAVKRQRWRSEKKTSGTDSGTDSGTEAVTASARNREQLNVLDPNVLKGGAGGRSDLRTERVTGVWLNDIEFEQGLLEYNRFGLNRAWAERGLLHTSRYLAQAQNSGKPAYAHWASWALRECLSDQRAGLDVKTAKERHQRAINGIPAGAQAGVSPPKPKVLNPNAVLPKTEGQ